MQIRTHIVAFLKNMQIADYQQFRSSYIYIYISDYQHFTRNIGISSFPERERVESFCSCDSGLAHGVACGFAWLLMKCLYRLKSIFYTLLINLFIN